ncbi:hypothetical protein [Numidum massiliense]|uniref:hypothetical protein n=1 Tax=Numidum massiliense TaxID=1522315 RepID=UPI0006D5ADE0|nr:hypothetical protein [Numidum massiliense]
MLKSLIMRRMRGKYPGVSKFGPGPGPPRYGMRQKGRLGKGKRRRLFKPGKGGPPGQGYGPYGDPGMGGPGFGPGMDGPGMGGPGFGSSMDGPGMGGPGFGPGMDGPGMGGPGFGPGMDGPGMGGPGYGPGMGGPPLGPGFGPDGFLGMGPQGYGLGIEHEPGFGPRVGGPPPGPGMGGPPSGPGFAPGVQGISPGMGRVSIPRSGFPSESRNL